jgi:cytochrome c553
MKRMLKWAGVVVAVLIAVAVVGGAVLYVAGGSKFDGPSGLRAESVRVADGAALAWGEHLVATHACMDCHGERLEGTVLVDAPPFRVVASNLTGGAGGVGARLDAAGWERAIRHGVGVDGRGLAIMPSEVYTHLSDEDLAALIAYLQAVPRVDNELPATELRPLGRVIAGLGQIEPTSALVDHDAPHPASNPPVGATAEYGRYRASTTCNGCHGERLEGAQPPNPDSPVAPSLHHIAGWTFDQFATTMRTGVTPAGLNLDSMAMPWPAFGKMRDEELQALQLHIQQLAAGAASQEQQ